jgi:DNA-binding response OmpR family regulator/HPt (histidine-containing phosphotransfer) domain-containing protein
MKILVVEDDQAVADALKITLSDQMYAVEVAGDGQAGLDFVEAFDYDLLLLDAILPKLDGISLCRYLRSRGYMMPILLLTSQDSNHDRAIGLDAGADDYVVKPFDPEELSARIRALLRRGNDRAKPVLQWAALTLNPSNYEVTYQDRLLNLTPKEYALLELFLRYSRRLFSCGSILEHLWTYEDAPSEEAVRTHIKGLRHKLKLAGAPSDFVETVYGIGYRLRLSDPATDHQSEAVAIVNIPTRQVKTGSVSDPQSPVTTDFPKFLTEIWNRHYPQMLDRVASIDRAIFALIDLSLDPEIRHQAWQSAHTLAGGLGTFGLQAGSQAAKQIELLLAKNATLTPTQAPQLQSWVAQLRSEIATKTPPPTVKTATEQTKTTKTTKTATPIKSPIPWLLMISRDLGLISALSYAATGRFEILGAVELITDQLVQAPHLVIVDLDCFPQITDGLTALSKLDRDYPGIPTVVLSPSEQSVINGFASIDRDPTHTINGATPILRQRIEAARRGASQFLLKPMAMSQILQAIDQVLQPAASIQAKVTIVDDDRLLLDGIGALLSQQGMIVTTLSEPSQFWETLETSTPDLLILDLDMPTHNGIELCRAVRTDPVWARLPILFLTANTAAMVSDRIFAAGADDFVSKPVVGTTLVNRIVNRLERVGQLRQS